MDQALARTNLCCRRLWMTVDDGGWTTSPMSVGMGARWLRSLLYKSGEDVASVRALGTHSLKATGLSWAAKWGTSKELRVILGYHSSARSNCDVVYGRDNVAPALREFDAILESIALDKFRPDATRSGMFMATPHLSGMMMKFLRLPRAARTRSTQMWRRKNMQLMKLLGRGSPQQACVRRWPMPKSFDATPAATSTWFPRRRVRNSDAVEQSQSLTSGATLCRRSCFPSVGGVARRAEKREGLGRFRRCQAEPMKRERPGAS